MWRICKLESVAAKMKANHGEIWRNGVALAAAKALMAKANQS
jgi:hypothetical protein